MRGAAAIAAIVIAIGCGSHAHGPTDVAAVDTSTSPDAPAPYALTIALDRAAGSHDVLVTVHVSDASGAPFAGAIVGLDVLGGSASSVTDAGSGNYTATVTPAMLDTEVPITATCGVLNATKIALALTTIDDSFGQPEAVDGLVNTPAWEDGANISPDGQWLIVASYVPMDLLSCSIAGNSTAAPCQAITGPSAAPARPGALGAARIHGATFDNDCPDLGITTPQTGAQTFVPISAFGFHRQADGSFAEPFAFGMDADGCLGPYGYAFTGQPQGTAASVVFSDIKVIGSGSASDADLYYTPLTLGQPNNLGTYRLVGGSIAVTGFTGTLVPPQLATRQGNPSYGGGRIYWDDEDLATTDRDLFFADLTGTLPSVTAGAVQTVGVSQPGIEDIQPSIDGADLYWMRAGSLARATLSTGADPSLAASWSTTRILAGASPTSLSIIALGEPNAAHVGGQTELYFVYILKTATGGYDSNIGRVVTH